MIPYLFDDSACVSAITGHLGGGKTLSSVAVAVDAFRSGHFVATNVWLDLRKIEKYLGYEEKTLDSLYLLFSVDSSFDFSTLPSGSPRGSDFTKKVVVIIDEVAEFYNQYVSGRDSFLTSFLSWLRHTSKRGQYVYLVVQRIDFLNKSIRLLCLRIFSATDLAQYRLPFLRIKLPFLGSFCLLTVHDSRFRRLGTAGLFRKSVYGRFYRTAQILSSSKTFRQFDRPVIYTRFPFILLLFVIYTFFIFFTFSP